MATFIERTRADGTHAYQVRVRLRGEAPRTRTFKRKTDAKAWAAEVENALGKGSYVPTSADRRHTLAELIDKYITEYLPTKPHGKDRRNIVRQLQWWKEHMGFITMDRLDRAAIKQARTELLKSRSGPTVNRYLAALSSACKYGWKELEWLPHNPVLAIPRSAENPGVVRFLSEDERKRLLIACRDATDPNILPTVLVALATGLRYSNIRFATWENFDRASGVLFVPTTKNGEPRRVPIVEPALTAILRLYEADPIKAGWMFKGQTDAAPANVAAAWRTVRDAAGLRGFRFHDLRHTVGSYAAMSGASIVEIAELLGHKTLAMARRYSHTSTDHVRSVAERMVGKMMGVDDDTGGRHDPQR